MIKMKRIYPIIIIILFISVGTQAQQMPQLTQYMYNTTATNPDNAGNRDAISVVEPHKSQWT